MIKRFLILTTLGLLTSGCFMAPLALMGPAVQGFSTASIIQSGASQLLSAQVKIKTGKSIKEHALGALTKESLQQSYFPKEKTHRLAVSH